MFFATPFSPTYWRTATQELKSIRTVAMAALFVGIHIVISTFFIPLGENLRIYFSFFVTALGSLIYGPVVGVMTGFVSDILGYMLHPSGAFFPGYVLTAMAGALVYALFFYRARITVLRIFLCKLCINVFVNVGMGSLWSAMLFGKGYYYYLVKSVIKNTLLLPVEVLLLVLFFRMMFPILTRHGLTPAQPSQKIPLL